MGKIPLATLLLLALSRAALADVPAKPPVTPSAPLPAPTVSAPVSAAPTVPPPPPVDDPMLAPVPPPKRVISSWKEAQDFLRARSTNLKTALDQVLQAEGQTIVALAQYLPSLGGCAGGALRPRGVATPSTRTSS